MNKIDVYIPLGIGDLINVRSMFDTKLFEYEKINIILSLNLLDQYKPDFKEQNIDFLLNLAKLIFNNEKYTVTASFWGSHMDIFDIKNKYKLGFSVPSLRNELCTHEREIEEEYVVLTTKVRAASREHFLSKKQEFIDEIIALSKKYKIVLLGERVVEMNKEYQGLGHNSVFSIYEPIYSHIKDVAIDKTIPALGVTIPELETLKRDCSIMRHAKKVITLGSGGNFSIASVVANAVCYFEDSSYDIFRLEYKPETTYYTKKWDEFLKEISKI
jgi:hypothetical protein